MLILKQLRRKKKLSQTDLANAIGVSLRTIQLYEKKEANIPIKNLTKIAEYFDLSIAELYMHEVNEESGIYLNTMTLTKNGNKVYGIEPNKYFVIVPLVTQDSYKQYIEALDNPSTLNKLPKIGFMLDHIEDVKHTAFEVLGDSMNDGTIDAIPNKAIVLGRKIQIKENIEENKIIGNSPKIIVCQDRVLCKQIIGYDEEANTVVCHNFNSSPEHKDFELPLGDVLQVFEIVKKQI